MKLVLNGNQKVLAILIIVTLVYFAAMLPIIENDLGDSRRHYAKVMGCEGVEEVGWNRESCEIYKPLLSWIGKIFTNSFKDFLILGFVILGILTPLLLFRLTGNWFSVLSYFAITSYFYSHIDGIFAQGLATLIAFTILNTKDWRLDLVLIGLAGLAHGHGAYLASLIFITKHMTQIAFFFCSGTFGENSPKIVEELRETIGNVGGVVVGTTSYLYGFIRVVPLPFLFIASRKNWKDKEYALLLITVVALVGTVFVSIRVFFIAVIPMLIGWTSFYASAKPKNKLIILGVTVLFGLYQAYAYFNLKFCLGMIEL